MTNQPQDDIFGPMFAMFVLTILVWFRMYSKRLPFLIGYIEKHKIGNDMEVLNNPASKHYFPSICPPIVRNPSDNLKNLFEVPILFYAMVMYLYMTQQVDHIYLGMAWAFAGARAAHSFIQCTSNAQPHRFYVYLFSSAVMFALIFRAMYSHVVLKM